MLLLAGCGEAEGLPLPTPTTQVEKELASSDITESLPLETSLPEERPVPEEPEAMKTGDKAGAIAAAEFFVEVIEYSLGTNSRAFLSEYSYERCTNCNHMLDLIDQRIGTNFSSIITDYKIVSVGEPEFVGKGVIIWRVPIDLKIEEMLTGEEESRVTEVTLNVFVSFEADVWELTEVEPDLEGRGK
ncbi:DUF6318 family protein [Jonesia quinghaiensis]|uniref:DUF6318 family protein n=1 Tax=Jonesia quinghaiensis TaxID=262806 RepID=UPI0012F79BB8|nr:DUF6318 family protein [Jonesia quinghaiensis]